MTVPKWVLCGVCEEMLWAGPSNFSVEGHPLPRECRCRATRVVPTMERGFVQWDKDAYRAAAEEKILASFRKQAQAEAEKAGLRAGTAGSPPEMVAEAYRRTLAEANTRLASTFDAELANYPAEPEVEYAEEGEVLIAPAPQPAKPTTIGQLYKQHWADVEKGSV